MADLLLTEGTLVDGSGSAPFAGWVAVTGDRIESVGRSDETPPAAGVVVATPGQIVAPGFIDVHNHSDLSPFVLPEMPSTLRQGVTSVVVGNCGSSPWPLSSWDESLDLAYSHAGALPRPAWASWRDYLDAIDEARPAVNIATLIGHGSVRRDVLGDERRSATPGELDRMRGSVRDAVTEGAVGLSTGLIYVPGLYSSTDEVVTLAGASAAAGGLYASHIRGEGRDLFRAIDEAFEIGARAGLPVHVSHLKCESSRMRGRAGEVLATLHDAPDATADQYPYGAWNSSLSSLLPPWAPVADVATIAETDAKRLRHAVEVGEIGFQSSVDGVGWDQIVLVAAPDPAWRGRSVGEVADELGVGPFDAFVELLRRDPVVSCIGHAMSDEDVDTILSDPQVFVASDASATAPDGPAGDLPVHPRDYGTFPRALAAARDSELLPIEAMVRKMTALPAARFGLRDRGELRAGWAADLVVFDPAAIHDTATYAAPHAFPSGISNVFVNGVLAWPGGDGRIERAGRALRRT